MKINKMYKDIFRQIKANKFIYLLVTVCIFIDAFVFMFPTEISRRIINYIGSNSLTFSNLSSQLSLMLFLTILSYGIGYLWSFLLWETGNKVKMNLRESLFKKILDMRTKFFNKFTSGDILTLFSTDIEGYIEIIEYGFMALLFSIADLIFIIPMMIRISFNITIFALIPLFLMSFFQHYVHKKIEHYVEINRENISSLNNEVLEDIEGIRVVRAYSKYSKLQENFNEKTKTLKNNLIKLQWFDKAPQLITHTCILLSRTFILFLGTIAVSKGQLKIGDIIALNIYVSLLIDSAYFISDLLLLNVSSKVSYSRIFNFLNEGDEIEKKGNLILEDFKEFNFKNYNFKYSTDDKYVLDNINLKINKGDFIGIVGKTGSGKTTLIKQFLRQYPKGNGIFEINNKDIIDYDIKSIENHISYVPQEYFLFSKSVLENVKIGKYNSNEKEIDNAIINASFKEDLNNMKDGLNTLVGERGVSTSGGQKQRILLSRAFLKGSEVMILDDSLSAVDAKTEERIIKSIKNIRKDKTTIIVSHRLSAVSSADWIIVLDNGKIVEEGKHDYLLSIKGWYYKQYINQKIDEVD